MAWHSFCWAASAFPLRFVGTFVSLLIVLAAGWMATEILGESFEKKTQVQALGEIDVLASRLNGETAAVDGMAISLAGSPSVRATLSGGMAGGSRRDRQLAVSMLNLDVAAARAKAGYLLDKAGGVVAISDDGETARLEAPMAGVSLVFANPLRERTATNFRVMPGTASRSTARAARFALGTERSSASSSSGNPLMILRRT